MFPFATRHQRCSQKQSLELLRQHYQGQHMHALGPWTSRYARIRNQRFTVSSMQLVRPLLCDVLSFNSTHIIILAMFFTQF